MHYTPFTPRPSVGNPDRISPRTWARISVDSEDHRSTTSARPEDKDVGNAWASDS